MSKNFEPYCIELHRHRFAVWAAGRAASVKNCRFSVETAKFILEKTDLPDLVLGKKELPEKDSIDICHRGWRELIIQEAKEIGLNEMTHGVAAKLINVYLKAGLVCVINNEKTANLHPPIDALLLNELYQQNVGGLSKFWNQARQKKWSKFDSAFYEQVIDNIRTVELELWRIERYWSGHQSKALSLQND